MISFRDATLVPVVSGLVRFSTRKASLNNHILPFETDLSLCLQEMGVDRLLEPHNASCVAPSRCFQRVLAVSQFLASCGAVSLHPLINACGFGRCLPLIPLSPPCTLPWPYSSEGVKMACRLDCCSRQTAFLLPKSPRAVR